MTATRLFYRPGSPGLSVRLQLENLPDGMLQIRAWQCEGNAEWREFLPAHVLTHHDADAALLREEDRWLSEGFLRLGLSVPAADSGANDLPAAWIKRALARLQPEGWRLLTEGARRRLVWRVGELRLSEAADYLPALLGTGDAMLDYCLVWALGRCGSAHHAVPVLKWLDAAEMHAAEGVAHAARRLGRAAWLHIASAADADAWRAELVGDWPAPLRAAWASGLNADWSAVLADATAFKRISMPDWLEQFDLAAPPGHALRSVLHDALRVLPWAAGNVRTLRHLYKLAEMRGEADVWALLARRCEQTPANFGSMQSYLHVGRRWVRAADELAKPASRLAWSRATRDYFIRRNWRCLRRRGAAGQGEFTELATALLLQFDDGDSAAHTQPAFSQSVVFNQLLYRNDGRIGVARHGTRCWQREPLPPERTQRVEAYPAQWTARPDCLLRLLLEARSAAVHRFAARALADCTAYVAKIPADIWRCLLNSPFAATAGLALQHVQTRLAAGADLAECEYWLIMLLQSRHEAVWQAGLRCVTDDPARYAARPALVAAVLTAQHELVRRQGRLLCQAARSEPNVAQAIVLALLVWLEALDGASQQASAQAADLVWVLQNTLRVEASALATTHASRLQCLLVSPCAAARISAVDWLLLQPELVASLPVLSYRTLLDSPDEAVQAAGVRLFGALPDAVLLEQSGLVARFCAAPAAAVRQAAIPVVGRLATQSLVFSQSLAEALADGLFRAEAAEGIHADVLATLSGVLAAVLPQLDSALAVRLLMARSRSAQMFGEQLLSLHTDDALSSADWARLAKQNSLVVRQRALLVLAQRLALAPADTTDHLIRMLDSRWDDARAGALAVLETAVPADAWQTEQIIALCDHLQPAVQVFGQRLLRPRLEAGGALDCLLQLADHPAPRMQAFVAEWLLQALPGKANRMTSLRPYFITVLSQVNRGRAAKIRVQALLRQLVPQSAELAHEVGLIFERMALTVAIADRAQYIAGLHEIARHYPDIATGLTVVAPRSAGAS